MNSSKCPNCGLVNFAAAEVCKRCAQPLFGGSQSQAFAGDPTQYHAPQFAQPPVQAPAAKQKPSLWENHGFRKILFGLCWITGGLILTQFTTYIFYGAIIFGAIDVVRGAAGMFVDTDV